MSERPQIKLTRPEIGFFRLVWSDYRAAIRISGKDEPVWKGALLWLLRTLFNPSLQLAVLVRIGQRGPGVMLYPVRWLQVVFFSSEIWWFRGETAIVIGPGVVFPHPINILVGPGTVIGEGVAIYNNTQIGADRHFEIAEADSVAGRATNIGDHAVIYPYSVVQGPFNVGEESVVGLRVFLDEHVPPGALKTNKGIRLRGEWPGVRGTKLAEGSEKAGAPG